MPSSAARAQYRRRARRAGIGFGCALALAVSGGLITGGGAAPAATIAPAAAAPGAAPAAPAPPADTGSLTGHVTAPSTDSSTIAPVAAIAVTATGATGITYHATTDANGFYELDALPAPASYTLTFAPSAGAAQTQSGVAVAVASNTTANAGLSEPVATITGAVTDARNRPLPGMTVGLSSPVTDAACPAGTICGPSTTSGPDGAYTLSVVAGSYELAAQDAGQLVDVQSVAATSATRTVADVHLAPAAVPAGTTATHATRDLRWLNAERRRSGVPAGVVLNPRWSQECAAHDAYERANDVLSAAEDPQSAGASTGGAWAGLVSVLAQSRWSQSADPWQNAPIHLMQLLTPSLSVIGLDDSGGLQCATTYPGLVHTPVTSDVVTTAPGAGATGVPPRELAREAPFVPGQFVGIPAGRATGRELFVYLNESGQTGQAQVKVLRATLSLGGRAVAVRWVDNSTPTVGRYLTGAILIPVRPLRGHSTYQVGVEVQDRSQTLTHSWSFTTARG